MYQRLFSLKKVLNSRRFFLKALGLSIGGLCFGFWGTLVKTQKTNAKRKTITISLNDNREVLFHEDCIVVNAEKPRVFSSYCSHLGCRIQTYENGQLICPCHGSAFDMDGNSLKGPAVKPLNELEYKLNPDTKSITVNI